MRVSREHSEARSTRPLIGPISGWLTAVGICLMLVVPTSLASASSAQPPPPAAAPTRLATHAPDAGVPPTVNELAVPTVARADRVTTAARTASRSGFTSTPAKATASPSSLVAHVRSRVSGGFSMIGVTWAPGGAAAATPAVVARTRTHGTWSRWTELAVDPDEAPAKSEDSSVRNGTEPVFVGAADAVEVDVYSSTGTPPKDLKVSAIDPGSAPTDATAAKTATATAARPARDGLPQMPRIVTRKQWGADESLGDPCWPPRYGRTFKAVFVHHTAGSNTYTRRESPSIVRGIYAYHTQSRDWCDIGYNFLVDKYGTVYEGRAGGIRKPVRGAHAGDYNVNSTGISLMGEFTHVFPTRPMRHSLTKLIAWRLGVAYHGAYGKAQIYGKAFQRISGHRDAMSTSCPGQRVYDWLPTLRHRVNLRLDHFTSVIKRFWLHSGGIRGYLGPVRVGEVAANGGRHTTFAHARTYFKNGHRSTFRAGAFLTAYLNNGEVWGPLGYPISPMHGPRNGYFADFEGGGLYWSPKSGGRILTNGKVLARYRHLDGPRGRLGYPETWLRNTADGSFARFRFGTIRFDKKTQRTTVSYQ